MTDRELMQMALDALEWCYDVTEWPANGNSAQDKAIDALRARLAQPEPDYSKAGFVKPRQEEGCSECGKKASDGWALYCVKCTEREWKWLTDEEIKEIIGPWGGEPIKGYTRELIDKIESKLKEKNG